MMKLVLKIVLLMLPLGITTHIAAQPIHPQSSHATTRVVSSSVALPRSPIRHPVPSPMPRPPHHQPPHVQVIYQAPTYVQYHQNTFTWVNGEPNVAQIHHAQREVITGWRRLGLPAPPHGMYWIFENGRYSLVPTAK